MSEDELRRAARLSGIRGGSLPSLEQVERRRFELWLVSTLVVLGVSAGVVALTMRSPEELHAVLANPVVRFALLALPVALCGYSIEKELSLRRVSTLLLDERLLTTALSNRLHEISALLDAGRAVNSTLELDRVLSSILSGATDLLPASSGSVMLLEDDVLVVVAAVGNDAALGRRASLGEGIAGHVARTREPLLVDGRATPGVFPGLLPRTGAEVRSALCVPLVERDELLGVLNLSAPAQGEFSEYDLRAVSLFAEQAATAIGKARLYEHSLQQAVQLERAAHHDALTGLANRASLDERTARTAGGETLLFLDLDGFKEVNDRLGHAAGDQVLAAVGARLRGSLKAGDLPARFGGDEFAVLLGGSPDPRVAELVATRLVRELSAPISVLGGLVDVSASIGIALPEDGVDAEALLQRADRALYAAKAAGKGCWRRYGASVPAGTPAAAGVADQLPVPRPPGVGAGALS